MNKQSDPISIVFPACLGIGVAAGALMHNVGMGMALGAALGTILRLVLWYRLERRE
jgi:hypothetical protein